MEKVMEAQRCHKDNQPIHGCNCQNQVQTVRAHQSALNQCFDELPRGSTKTHMLIQQIWRRGNQSACSQPWISPLSFTPDYLQS